MSSGDGWRNRRNVYRCWQDGRRCWWDVLVQQGPGQRWRFQESWRPLGEHRVPVGGRWRYWWQSWRWHEDRESRHRQSGEGWGDGRGGEGQFIDWGWLYQYGRVLKGREETSRFTSPIDEPTMKGVGGMTPGVVTAVHFSLGDVSTIIYWSSSSFTLPVWRPGQGGTTKLVGADVGAFSFLWCP